MPGGCLYSCFLYGHMTSFSLSLYQQDTRLRRTRRAYLKTLTCSQFQGFWFDTALILTSQLLLLSLLHNVYWTCTKGSKIDLFFVHRGSRWHILGVCVIHTFEGRWKGRKGRRSWGQNSLKEGHSWNQKPWPDALLLLDTCRYRLPGRTPHRWVQVAVHHSK